MQTALRKMGNSTGMILPRSILGELGVVVGAAMDLRVEDGKLVVTPVSVSPRAGWAEAAAKIGDTDEEVEWRGFGNIGDADLTW